MKRPVINRMVLLVGAVLASASFVQEPSFLGVWQIDRTIESGPRGRSVQENPEPGYFMFTERHLSIALIPGGPRARLPANASEAARLEAYDNFIVDLGTYERTDSTFTLLNLIAKVPNVMPPYYAGSGLIFRYRFESTDRLHVSFRAGWAPPDGELTYELRRLE